VIFSFQVRKSSIIDRKINRIKSVPHCHSSIHRVNRIKLLGYVRLSHKLNFKGIRKKNILSEKL